MERGPGQIDIGGYTAAAKPAGEAICAAAAGAEGAGLVMIKVGIYVHWNSKRIEN